MPVLICGFSTFWRWKAGKVVGHRAAGAGANKLRVKGSSVASSAGYIILAKTGLREEQGVKGRAEVALVCLKKTIIRKKWWNAGWVFAALLADSDERNRRETSSLFQLKWCHYRLKSTSSQPVTLLSFLTSLEQHFQRISWQSDLASLGFIRAKSRVQNLAWFMIYYISKHWIYSILFFILFYFIWSYNIACLLLVH